MILKSVAQLLVNVLRLSIYLFKPNTFRGTEVAVALDFVRGMDEEGLKLLLEQGEVNIENRFKWFNKINFNRCSD